MTSAGCLDSKDASEAKCVKYSRFVFYTSVCMTFSFVYPSPNIHCSAVNVNAQALRNKLINFIDHFPRFLLSFNRNTFRFQTHSNSIVVTIS